MTKCVCPICNGQGGRRFLSAPDRFHWRTKPYDLFRCSDCSYVWLEDPPSPTDMSDHYGIDYHKSIMAAGESSGARWSSQREAILKQRNSGTLLDLGCSSGGFLSSMSQESWKLFGIELDGAAAEKARCISGASIFVGDVAAAPFPPESFDVITCFDVLEHVYSPRQVLIKVKELLKPGGIFFAVLPNIESWEARIFGSYWYGLELPRHISHFSPQSLRHIMNALGFKELTVFTSATTYSERSASYLRSAVSEKVGFARPSMAKRERPNLLSRAVRKSIRMSVFEPFGQLASAAGAGASIDAIFFKKPCGADARFKAVI